MKQDGSIAIFQYWDRLRGDRPAPRQNEIEPAHIKSVLADTFILERNMRGKAIFRLAGTRVGSIYGRELKGASFHLLWNDMDRRTIDPLVEGLFRAKEMFTLAFEGFARQGRSARFEMVMLPLDADPESQRCLGLVSVLDKPFWLGADPIVDTRIESVRMGEPAIGQNASSRRSEIDAPALLPIDLLPIDPQSKPSNPRRIRHLVVLDGGRTE